jgi:hypothetical protein
MYGLLAAMGMPMTAATLTVTTRAILRAMMARMATEVWMTRRPILMFGLRAAMGMLSTASSLSTLIAAPAESHNVVVLPELILRSRPAMMATLSLAVLPIPQIPQTTGERECWLRRALGRQRPMSEARPWRLQQPRKGWGRIPDWAASMAGTGPHKWAPRGRAPEARPPLLLLLLALRLDRAAAKSTGLACLESQETLMALVS